MMERRMFLNLAAGGAAAMAINPGAMGEMQERKVVAYPDPAVEVVDARFEKYRVINAAVERLYTGTRWGEVPVWFGGGRFLVFRDSPHTRILRWVEETVEVSVISNSSN